MIALGDENETVGKETMAVEVELSSFKDKYHT
jgi:hypothetical protein